MAVAQWATQSLLRWPGETLDWLVRDGTEPSWLKLLSSGFVDDDMPSVDPEDVRLWREQIRVAAESNAESQVWNHTAPLGSEMVAFEVRSPEVAGRWSGFTIARFADEAIGGSEPPPVDDVWIRFEPRSPAPTTDWLVVTSIGWLSRIDQNDRGQVHIAVELADPEDQDVPLENRGELVIDADLDRIDGVLSEVSLNERGRIRRADVSVVAGNREKKLRVAVSGKVSLRPRWHNGLTLVWPVVRLFVSRRLGRQVKAMIDGLTAAPEWAEVVAASRLDRERRVRTSARR